MKRTVWTILAFFTVTVARASDLATTFHFNPTLSREVNPFVALVGGSTTSLLLSNLFGLVLLLYIPLLLYWRVPLRRLDVVPATVRDFASLLLYGRVLARGQFLRACLLGSPLPKHWIQVLRLWGFAGCWTVAFGSFLAAFSWWAVSGWQWTWYQAFRSYLAPGNYPVVELLACIPVGYLAAVAFFRTEFSEFKSQTPSRET